MAVPLPCGAVAADDATGHNLGDALMEATAFAYGDDWETALAMEEDEDFEIRYLDCYHRGDHRVLGGGRTYGTGLAAFVFVKVKSLKHLLQFPSTKDHFPQSRAGDALAVAVQELPHNLPGLAASVSQYSLQSLIQQGLLPFKVDVHG